MLTGYEDQSTPGDYIYGYGANYNPHNAFRVTDTAANGILAGNITLDGTSAAMTQSNTYAPVTPIIIMVSVGAVGIIVVIILIRRRAVPV